MSGSFFGYTSRYWDATLRANMSPAVFFLEWMLAVDSHVGLKWDGYGTGKSQLGVAPPIAWLTWNPALSDPPWADNSWVVFTATNASPALDGSGGQAWQCKLQVTLSTGFDDCNVADTDYGKEATTYIVCGRVSARGGWSSVTLDFTHAASNNYTWFGGTDASGKNPSFYLNVIGDDDTLAWDGAAFSSPADIQDRTRGGYLGMLRRRTDAITYPFLYSVGRIANIATMAGGGERGVCGRNRGSADAFQWTENLAPAWPSYSLFSDGTAVTTHRHDTCYNYLWFTAFIPTGEDILYAIPIAQYQAPNSYGIIGEMRFIAVCSPTWAYHEVRGVDPQWTEIAAQNRGIAMRWPTGVVPVW